MEKSTAQTIVKVAAILAWIDAGATALLALLFFVGGPILAQFLPSVLPVGELGIDVTASLIGAAAILVGVFFFAFAVLDFFIGKGLWFHKNWARILVLVIAWIGGVGALISLFSGNPGNIVGLVINGALVWLFQFEKTVVGLFAATPKVGVAPANPVKAKK
ncbi:MAG: hypothetical protein ABIH41_07545 [Nanoarchaeota archaeon]